MNEMTPPAFTSYLPPQPPAIEPPLAEPAVPEPPAHLPRLLLSLAVVVALFDVCFWDAKAAGFSVAVFFAGLTGLILLNRTALRGRGTIPLLVALMLGAIVATVIEPSVSNSCALFMLLVALAGETYFTDVESSWGRWLSLMVAWLRAPGRLIWLFGELATLAFRNRFGGLGTVAGGILLALPALFLALVFGSLLADGNAVFSSWADKVFSWILDELALILNPGRIVLWCFVILVSLPLLRPVMVSRGWWEWTQRLPQFPEVLPTRGAVYCSGLILVVLNLLFLVANTADAFYLWTGAAIPAGVDYKTYVHEGVNSLIVSVILSAIVMAVIFQQASTVSQRQLLKGMAYLWIIQNIVLLVSVAERVRRYIVYYQLTPLRLGCLIFLILVAVGFVLLTVKIAKGRSLSWLIGGCILSIFGTFYITQFLDLAGWSSNYNATRFEIDKAKLFDTKTMCRYGAPVWPGLARAHAAQPTDTMISDAILQERQGADYRLQSGQSWQYWREFTLRAWWNRPYLDATPQEKPSTVEGR